MKAYLLFKLTSVDYEGYFAPKFLGLYKSREAAIEWLKSQNLYNKDGSWDCFYRACEDTYYDVAIYIKELELAD